MIADTRVAVGLDLVQTGQVAAAIERFGKRYLDRIFTEAELRYCLAEPGPSAYRLAARFAAKEAVRKLLCVGDEAIGWRSIEVVRASSGQCHVELHGEALALAEEGGYVGVSLSMTHESDYASAVVLGERRSGKGAER
jgi:holo-[acyl-carrier protein] synthase